MNLMQNCDLPPPMKVFMGSDNKTVISSMNKKVSSLNNMGVFSTELDDNRDKLELLKALRLSQTRAREAEKKVEVLARERDFLSEALLEEAKHLFAHRQWMRLLEFQVSSLHAKWVDQENHQVLKADDKVDDQDRDDEGVFVPWVLALAFCFGIAFGCRYFF